MLMKFEYSYDMYPYFVFYYLYLLRCCAALKKKSKMVNSAAETD